MNGAAIFEFNFRSVNISRISYRPQFLIFALLSAIWLLFVPIGSSYGNELPGKIVGITDGDTVVGPAKFKPPHRAAVT